MASDTAAVDLAASQPEEGDEKKYKRPHWRAGVGSAAYGVMVARAGAAR